MLLSTSRIARKCAKRTSAATASFSLLLGHTCTKLLIFFYLVLPFSCAVDHFPLLLCLLAFAPTKKKARAHDAHTNTFYM